MHRPDALTHHSEETEQSCWDDLRLFLACVDHGSFRKAADSIGITSTTVMRRIDRLEESLNCRLFLRHQGGLRVTDEGRMLVDDIRQMERLSFNVYRRASNVGPNPAGTVRVAVTEGIGTYWIMPKLIEFQSTYRLLTVDLRCAMEHADVGRLEADIAIQFEKPTNPDLIVTRLGRLHVHAFASEDYARQHGVPKSLPDLKNHRLIQQVAPQLDEAAFARLLGLESLTGVVGIRTNSSTALLYAIERGAGIGVLPTYSIALGVPLVACDLGVSYHRDLWVTYHPDLKRSEKHMVVVDWLKRIFDPARYPCFRDDFIHPNELVTMMAVTAQNMSGRGYAAAMPFQRTAPSVRA